MISRMNIYSYKMSLLDRKSTYCMCCSLSWLLGVSVNLSWPVVYELYLEALNVVFVITVYTVSLTADGLYIHCTPTIIVTVRVQDLRSAVSVWDYESARSCNLVILWIHGIVQQLVVFDLRLFYLVYKVRLLFSICTIQCVQAEPWVW